MGARFLDTAWEEPDTYPPQHGLLIRTGRAGIEAPFAFGTGEGDADRWSAEAGVDTTGYIDGDRIWGVHRVIGSHHLRLGTAPGWRGLSG